MYIKIKRGCKEKLFDCSGSEWVDGERSGELVIIRNDGGYIIEDIECIPENEVYFMNDYGKTIDRKCWKR